MFRLKIGPAFVVLAAVAGLLCVYSSKYRSSLSGYYSSRFSRNPQAVDRNQSVVVDDSIILLNKAYWEQIDPSSARIRILAFAKCNFTDSIQLRIGEDSEVIKLKSTSRPIEGDCPWHWAPGCEWNSFVIDSVIDLGRVEYDQLTVTYGADRSLSLPLRKVQERKDQDSLAVCVPPLYFYADWLRLAFFIETWKANGADHFYLYVQSVSASVRAVLDVYEKQGILTVIDWPLLPVSEFEDPNKSVYRLGHSLSHNDCRMRVKRKFVALVDLDEFVLPVKTNKTLVKYLFHTLKSHPLAGSFLFEHSKLFFPGWPSQDLVDSDHAWVGEATSKANSNGPTKAIFIADRADVILTHKVRAHFGIFSEVQIPLSEASLYHSRLNWIKNADFGPEMAKVNFFADNADDISSNMRASLVEADRNMPSGLNLNNTVVSTLIVRCLSEWQTLGCKTPFNTCYESVFPVDEWIITPDNGTFVVL